MVQVATAGKRGSQCWEAGQHLLSSARWRGRGWPGGKGCIWEYRSAVYPHPLADFQTHRINTGCPFTDTATDHNIKVTMISPYFTDTWAQTGHGRCQGCGRSKMYKYTNEPRVLQRPKRTAGRGDRKLKASSWNREAIPPCQAELAACKAGSGWV